MAHIGLFGTNACVNLQYICRVTRFVLLVFVLVLVTLHVYSP